jgi:DNA repair photolyase
VLIAPLMPGINDGPEQVEPLLELAVQAGATSIGGMALHLRGGVRGIFMEWLRAQRPDLVERYRELYRHGAYAPPKERERLSRMVRRRGRTGGFRLAGIEPGDPEPGGAPLRASRQGTLF